MQIKFEEKTLKDDEIFIGKLPILRIDQHYFQKEDFIDILIKVKLIGRHLL